MAAWSAFYSVTAEAAATLLGLLFVAVSIAAPSAITQRLSPIRSLAEQAFQNYLLVLILSAIELFPQTSGAEAGGVILVVAGSRTLWALVRLWPIVAHSGGWRTRAKALRRQVASLAGLACLLVAAIRMVAGAQDVSHLLAAGTLVLLASSAVTAWDLLLQLVKARSGEPAG